MYRKSKSINLKKIYIRLNTYFMFYLVKVSPIGRITSRGCAGGRIGTIFLRPRGTSSLKGANLAGTPGSRYGTESFFGLKGHPSFVRDV